MCYLSLGESSKAAALLQTVVESDHSLSNDAYWYLGLANLATGDTTNAIKILNQISTNNSHGYQKQSQELLMKLKN